MKLIIDIPEKIIAHIRSNYGHGYKGLYDEDRDKIVDAIYHGIPLDDVKAEIEGLRCGQPLRKFVVDECLSIIDKYKSKSEGKVNGKDE